MITPRILLTSCAVLLAPLVSNIHAQLVLSPGLVFAEQGGAIGVGNLGPSGTAFAKDVILGGTLPPHQTAHVNDGLFGNPNSWIGDSANSFTGVGFGSPLTIASFAFGRDNTNTFFDRAVGLYTIQFTADPNPAVNFLTNTWTTIGTISLNTDPTAGVTNPALRHRFNISSPVSATGFRLITPGDGIGSGAAIDELELFSTPGVVFPPVGPLVTHSVPGFTVIWDGNDGENSTPGGVVPNNLALASNAAVPISSGELGPQLGIPFHVTANINDGLYGNTNSWIGGDGNPAPFHAGVLLEDLYEITSISWGRDNTNTFGDRSLGTYTIQRTLDGVLWETVGSVDYNFGQDSVLGGGFTPHVRHEFDLSDGNGGILAMGMRLLVPGTGLNGGTDIDELELYGALPVPEPGSAALLALGSIVALRRRRM